MYKLSSQISYALRSHAADLAEEEDRVLASLGPEQVDNDDNQLEEPVQSQQGERAGQVAPIEQADSITPVKKGRGRPRKSVVETPVKTSEVKEDKVVVEIEVPVFNVEPPTVRRPDPSQTTPVRRTRTSLAAVASPAANTRSRNRTTTPVFLDDNGVEQTYVADSGSEEMITVTPAKKMTRAIRKTRSSSKLAE